MSEAGPSLIVVPSEARLFKSTRPLCPPAHRCTADVMLCERLNNRFPCCGCPDNDTSWLGCNTGAIGSRLFTDAVTGGAGRRRSCARKAEDRKDFEQKQDQHELHTSTFSCLTSENDEGLLPPLGWMKLHSSRTLCILLCYACIKSGGVGREDGRAMAGAGAVPDGLLVLLVLFAVDDLYPAFPGPRTP